MFYDRYIIKNGHLFFAGFDAVLVEKVTKVEVKQDHKFRNSKITKAIKNAPKYMKDVFVPYSKANWGDRKFYPRGRTVSTTTMKEKIEFVPSGQYLPRWSEDPKEAKLLKTRSSAETICEKINRELKIDLKYSIEKVDKRSFKNAD